MNSCSVCRGKTTQKPVTYTQWYEGKLIAIENVMADVCEACGEEYFSPGTVNKIQQALESNQHTKVMEVPVFQLK